MSQTTSKAPRGANRLQHQINMVPAGPRRQYVRFTISPDYVGDFLRADRGADSLATRTGGALTLRVAVKPGKVFITDIETARSTDANKALFWNGAEKTLRPIPGAEARSWFMSDTCARLRLKPDTPLQNIPHAMEDGILTLSFPPEVLLKPGEQLEPPTRPVGRPRSNEGVRVMSYGHEYHLLRLTLSPELVEHLRECDERFITDGKYRLSDGTARHVDPKGRVLVRPVDESTFQIWAPGAAYANGAWALLRERCAERALSTFPQSHARRVHVTADLLGIEYGMECKAMEHRKLPYGIEVTIEDIDRKATS